MIGLVARREVEQRLRGRTFRVATGVMLLAIAAAILVPTLRGNGHDRETVGLYHFGSERARIAVVQSGAQLGSAVILVEEPRVAKGVADLRAGLVDIFLV